MLGSRAGHFLDPFHAPFLCGLVADSYSHTHTHHATHDTHTEGWHACRHGVSVVRAVRCVLSIYLCVESGDMMDGRMCTFLPARLREYLFATKGEPCPAAGLLSFSCIRISAYLRTRICWPAGWLAAHSTMTHACDPMTLLSGWWVGGGGRGKGARLLVCSCMHVLSCRWLVGWLGCAGGSACVSYLLLDRSTTHTYIHTYMYLSIDWGKCA